MFPVVTLHFRFHESFMGMADETATKKKPLKYLSKVEYSYFNITRARILAYNSNTTRIELILFTQFARSHKSMNNYAIYTILTKSLTSSLSKREQ